MEKFLNNLENAAYQLKDKGEEALKKAAPAIQDGIDKAVDGAKDVYEKAKPTLDNLTDRAKDAYDKAAPSLREGVGRIMEKASDVFERAADSLRGNEKADETPEDAPKEPEKTHDQKLDDIVDAQMDKIRASRSEGTIISDYVSKTFGKDDQ